jgi:hypothetical protein
MAQKRYAVGKPGDAPTFIICDEGAIESHCGNGEIAFLSDLPAIGKLVINESGDDVLVIDPTLAENQSYTIELVNRIRSKAQGLGCMTAKGMIDTDDFARSNLALHAAAAPDDPSWSVLWTMHDNSQAAHSKADLVAALQIVAAYHAACHARARDLKAEIRAATSQDALDAIDYTSLWPEPDLSAPQG